WRTPTASGVTSAGSAPRAARACAAARRRQHRVSKAPKLRILDVILSLLLSRVGCLLPCGAMIAQTIGESARTRRSAACARGCEPGLLALVEITLGLDLLLHEVAVHELVDDLALGLELLIRDVRVELRAKGRAVDQAVLPVRPLRIGSEGDR